MNRMRNTPLDPTPPFKPSKLLAGALAGAIGVWALDRVDWFNYRREGLASRLQTRYARPGGEAPAHVAARRIEHAIGAEPSAARHHAAGMAVHYAIGIGPAIAYAVLRERLPALRAGGGAAFGAALFALQDELLNTVTGLGGDPRDYPWQAHARGAIAHVVYGIVTESMLRRLVGRPPGRAARA